MLWVFPTIFVSTRVRGASTYNIAAVTPHIDVWAQLPGAIPNRPVVTKKVVPPVAGDCGQSVNP